MPVVRACISLGNLGRVVADQLASFCIKAGADHSGRHSSNPS
jgi:hypothetical protein